MRRPPPNAASALARRPRRTQRATSSTPVFAAVARYFGLLSEPTRLKILHTICRDEQSVSAIVAATGATQTNVSRHLALMHQAGVVSRRREGNAVYYRVDRSRVRRDLPHRVRADRRAHRRARAAARRPARVRRAALSADGASMATTRHARSRSSPAPARRPRRAPRRGFLRRARRSAAARSRRRARAARAERRSTTCRRMCPSGAARSARRSSPSPYGVPSKYEANVAAPRKPGAHAHAAVVGLVHAAAEPVRHHHAVGPALRAPSPGRADIDPHAAPADGPRAGAAAPRVFTMDDLMRFPSVSRIHFIECGANTGMEWGNVAVPTVPVHARHARLQRIDRRAARRRCSTMCGVDRASAASSCSPKAPTARR